MVMRYKTHRFSLIKGGRGREGGRERERERERERMILPKHCHGGKYM